ncbi:MAG: SDR family NAD(P)-dependent oxidoreductase, partial [Waterburya sp.]
MSLQPQRIALVTGANKGLGFEISRQLAKQGIKVVMGVRDINKGKVALNQLLQVGLDVDLQYLDVTNIESIKAV